MQFHERRQHISDFVWNAGLTGEFSHVDPAGTVDNARMAIAVFHSKIGRDAFLAEVRQRGLWAWGLRVTVRPQVPRYL
eukprot:11807120-Alexandrium_andersonii.AAC.1